jgi:hypothetical protein
VVAGSAISRGRLSRYWTLPLALAWAAWAAHPYPLRDASRWLSEHDWMLLGWTLQEAKFFALLVFGVAAFEVGRRTRITPAPEPSNVSHARRSPARTGA